MVALAHYALQRGRVRVEIMVEPQVVLHRVVVLLYLRTQLVNLVLQLGRVLIGILVEEKHERGIDHRHNQR